MINERKTDIEYIQKTNEFIQYMNNSIDNFKNLNYSNEFIWNVFQLVSLDVFDNKINEFYITIIDPTADDRFLEKAGELSPKDELILFPTPTEFKALSLKNKMQEIFDYLVNSTKFNNVIRHEVTHQLNKIKSGGVIARANKSTYEDNTEEIQARLIPVFQDILDSDVKFSVFSDFVEYIKNYYHHELMLSGVSDNTKKRYLSRMYSFFQDNFETNLNESCNAQFKAWNKNLNIKESHNLFNLMDPLFNIREIIKEMVLLEDHLNLPNQNSDNCVNKHLIKCEALAKEAVSLNAGETLFINNMPTIIREWSEAWVSGMELTTIAKHVRHVRKQLMPIVLSFSREVLSNGGNINEVRVIIHDIRKHSQKTL